VACALVADPMVAAPLATVEEITVVDVSSGQALVHQLLDRRVQVAAGLNEGA